MIRIPENTTINGTLRSSGEFRMDGRFHGDGFIDGTLMLTETGMWTGNIVADIVVIEGMMEGDIIARKKLIVGAKAKINGIIKAPAIKIIYGAKLHCQLDMKEPQIAKGLLEHKPIIKNEMSNKHICNEKKSA